MTAKSRKTVDLSKANADQITNQAKLLAKKQKEKYVDLIMAIDDT